MLHVKYYKLCIHPTQSTFKFLFMPCRTTFYTFSGSHSVSLLIRLPQFNKHFLTCSWQMCRSLNGGIKCLSSSAILSSRIPNPLLSSPFRMKSTACLYFDSDSWRDLRLFKIFTCFVHRPHLKRRPIFSSIWQM